MKTSLVVVTALATLLLTGAASAAKKTYTANLDGDSETPAVDTDATGTATLTFDDQTKKLCGKVTHTIAEAVQAAHLHAGGPGTPGSPFVTLTPSASPINVNVTLTDGQITNLLSGQFYVNLHTAAHAEGEIRGDMTEGGEEQTCEEEDAGSNSSSSGSGGAVDSGTTSSSSGGSNGATTVRSDAGSTAAAPAEDDGCSTTGSAPGSGVAIVFGVGVALAAISRGRRKR